MFEGSSRALKFWGPPFRVKFFFVENIGFMGINRTSWPSRFQNCWNFCSSMSVAWEIIKKLPKIVWFGSEAFLGEFFDDFSDYRHGRVKISTVLESAKSYGSNDAHKPYISDNFFFYLTRGHTLGLKITGTLKNDPNKKNQIFSSIIWYSS